MDETLLRSSGGVVLAGVGAIEPGYILVCPTEHVMSLAELTNPASYLELVQNAVERLERKFGNPIVFEHGGCQADNAKSQCVAHAHLHLWAIRSRLSLSLPGQNFPYASLADFLNDSQRWRGAPYILGGTPGQLSVAADVGVPQFFRRQIAEALGRPDEWDYAAFWFEHNMRATIEQMRELE